jgi:hypothetical protein
MDRQLKCCLPDSAFGLGTLGLQIPKSYKFPRTLLRLSPPP